MSTSRLAALADIGPAVETITEVRRKEALLKTGALQNAILNSANFSIIATDEKGVIQLFNIGAETRRCRLAASAEARRKAPARTSPEITA